MRILPCGREALLVEVANLQEVGDLYLRLRRNTPPGVTDLVPAARTVLVVFDPLAINPGRLRALLRSASPESSDRGSPAPGPPSVSGDGSSSAATATGRTAGATTRAPSVTVPVRYEGPDLVDVARLTGLTPAQVVERHVRGAHRVAFCGFAPGFAYIAGLDPGLRVPRRDNPRTRVPAGSVAIADEFTGVYPRASPGGWHLIGRTDLDVFDLARDPPALLAPGTPVHFVAVDAASEPR